MAIQIFEEYMAQFLREKNAQDVVEIGSDIQLKLALNLAPHCKTFYSVNFPEDHRRMRGWYEMHQERGVTNIRFLSGNAVKLPDLISHADVIFLRNVLIDGNGTDTDLMWKYRRGESECSEEQWNELMNRFRQAEEDAFRGFFQVAKPGHIVRFGKSDDTFEKMIIEKLGINPEQIQTKKLFYDSEHADSICYPDLIWPAYFIDNS